GPEVRQARRPLHRGPDRTVREEQGGLKPAPRGRASSGDLMRWIWIDRFVEFDPGKSATAVKALSSAEDHFADHFPGFPVMPAALILEGLAQTGGILVGEANQFREKVILAKVPFAKFHREAMPGETL